MVYGQFSFSNSYEAEQLTVILGAEQLTVIFGAKRLTIAFGAEQLTTILGTEQLTTVLGAEQLPIVLTVARTTHHCSQSRTTHHHSQSRTTHYHRSRSRTTSLSSLSGRTHHHHSLSRITCHRSRSRTTRHHSRSRGAPEMPFPNVSLNSRGGATRIKAPREEANYNTEFYVETSYYPPRHSDTPNSNQTTSWKTDTPPAQLAGHNSEPVSHKHRTRLQNRLLDQTTTEAVPTSPSILSRPAPIDHGGDHRAVTETSYRGDTTIRGDSQVEKPLATRELVSQGQPKGCLLHDTHHHQYRKYLKSIFQERVYQFTCLPFELCSAHGYSPKSSNQPQCC